MKYTLVRPAAFCLLFGSIISTTAFATDGFYFGGGLHSTSIDGDFDGNGVYVGNSEAFFVPEIDTGQGFSIFGGLYLTPVMSIEVDYLSSSHDANIQGFPIDVDYSEFSVYTKFSFETSTQFKPTVLLGYGTSWIDVKEGSIDINGNLGNETFTGSGFNVGVGVDYFVHPSLAVGVRFVNRFANYGEVEGEIESGSLQKDLSGDTKTFLLAISYHPAL